MEVTLLRVLLVSSVWGLSAKHVYIKTSMSWLSAQAYCRNYFTDLSPISSARGEELFREAVGEGAFTGWIGLHRERSNPVAWKWSGGGYATYLNWASGEPHNDYYGIWTSNGWAGVYDYYISSTSTSIRTYYFYCLKLVVVEEKKSWEEALQHCREDHTELTSLVSETELLLAQREIQEAQTTERVWIGLRYLGDRWLWMNGEPLEYQAWPQGGDQGHLCPNWTHSCGALTKEGLWENWDCQEKLSFICY